MTFIETVIARAPEPLRRPLRVAATTATDTVEDRLAGLAAEIAFWVLLSLPALLLSVVAAFGVVGSRLGDDWETQLTDRVVEVSQFALTDSAIDNAVLPLLDQLMRGGGLGLVSIAFVAALWTASRAVKVVLQTVTLVGASERLRQGWKDRLLGFGITLLTMIGGVVVAPLLLAGPNFGEQLAGWLGVTANGIATVWRWAWWPVVIVTITLAISLLYQLGIPGKRRWRDQVPGAVFSMAVWLVGSAGLRIYGAWFMSSDSIYGPLAGPIVAMLWLWLSAFAVLLGAELNAAVLSTGTNQSARTRTNAP